jgi:uncharacterized protein
MKVERVFVDTNLFLRYLTNDAPLQAEAVEQLLKKAMTGKVALVTNSLVIAEIVWTLESFYRLSRSEIQEKVLAILNTTGLEVIEKDLVSQAIAGYSEKHVDFIDAYNAAWLLNRGMKVAYIFDRKHFQRFDGITVQVPGQESQEQCREGVE